VSPPEVAAPAARERLVLERIAARRARPALFRDARIGLAHGAGGKASRDLVEGLFLPAFDSEALRQLDDAGRVHVDGLRLALSTDTFVVRPLQFPGGSIGTLAVHGTLNDLAVTGARPLALTASFVLEEGLEAAVLETEVSTMAAAARAAGVELVAGDTKVVERGRADGMYVCTTGLGRVDRRAHTSPRRLEPGDRILLTGPLGRHGIAVLLARGEFELDAEVASDTRPLWPAVDALLEAAGGRLHAARDATRGGLGSVLNELATASGVGIVVRERDLPADPVVAGACEILGIDPLYVANEGQLAAFVAPDRADAALAALRAIPGFSEAADVGEVVAGPPGLVQMDTAFGGRRVVDLLVGDPLPRIC